MSKQKVPLQTYLLKEEREKYIAIHKANGTSAASEIREFIQRKIKQYGKN